VLAYGRGDGCRSLTGGAFAPVSWPEPYRGDYLFADYACGKIFRLEGTSRVDFATGLGGNSAVHLEVGPEAALYYTTFADGGQVRRIAPPVPPPTGGVFVSDLTPSSATNGYGPVERDLSNGGAAAGDGVPQVLNGVAAAKGLGVHAASTVTYALGGGYTSFLADVGIDDVCGNDGSVVFQVLVNGTKRFDSGVMRGPTATKAVSVNVTGATQLVLKVTNAGDGSACDHADWANARLTTPTTTTTSAPTTSTSAPTASTTLAPTTTSTSAPPTTTTTTVPPPTGAFVSDLTPSGSSNGYGPIERDMSNGGPAAGDGRPITLNGVGAAKGLGVHAASTVTYAIAGGGYTSFLADVGVDDACGNDGSVVFQVLVNGVKRFDSGVVRGSSDTKPVAVTVSGAGQLVLKVTNAGDGSACDHADWANARLV